jgi:hypothetical protein
MCCTRDEYSAEWDNFMTNKGVLTFIKCGDDQFGIRQPLANEFCKDGKKPVAILAFAFVGKVD